MRSSRIDEIQDYIFANKTVTIDDLCKRFDVSVNTIRRDLATLSERGTIKKIYGGVTTALKDNFLGLLPYGERTIKNIDSKRLIAKSAAELVCDNDIVYIDTGTTTVNLIDYLDGKQNVTILTNSIQAIMRALSHDNLKVICVPGVLDRKVSALTGTQTLRYLNNYNITKAFMACTAFSVKNGAMNSSPDEYAIKQAVVSRSAARVLLADADKYDKSALLTYSKLDDFDYIICNMTPDEVLANYVASADVKYVKV